MTVGIIQHRDKQVHRGWRQTSTVGRKSMSSHCSVIFQSAPEQFEKLFYETGKRTSAAVY